ncbi:MAG: peptide MFS transporter [Planctomycetes bacterium]|nr:peptide MFS transporter [Planctomycetota bacterium]
MASVTDESIPSDEPTILGHPRGLFVLFFAELWERFCYYGMRALLVFHLIAMFSKSSADAAVIYGAYTALVYALGVFGGYVADRVLGYRRSIMLGGVIMAIGCFTLISRDETVFLIGLATIIVGNGLFKPNISTLVGKLYKQGDPRRDSGFTIFYMGINLGAFLAPIFCARISRWMSDVIDPVTSLAVPDYRYGFMLAGIGMLLGLIVFGAGHKALLGKGEAPPERKGPMPLLMVTLGCIVCVPIMYSLLLKKEEVGLALGILGGAIGLYLLVFGLKSERVTRDRILALLLLLLCNIAFWASFEQAGNSLNVFAANHIHHLTISSWDWTMLPEDFQSVNAILIVVLGPVFAALWVKLARSGANPSIPAKFGLALIQVGLGFGLLLLGMQSADDAGKIPWTWLAGLYVIHTSGELCLSPVGLSMVTKLAPERMTGMVMGAWFVSIACANYGAGLFSKFAGSVEIAEDATGPAALEGYTQAFTPILWMAVSLGVMLFIASRLVNKLMHGVK